MIARREALAARRRARHRGAVRVGGFEVLGELGRGGMGVVYRVRTNNGAEAALKVLSRTNAAALARFERERRLLASFGEEEGFVGLLDAGSSPEGPWLLMPFVPGGTLRQRLGAAPLGVEETLALGIELATALGKAHERGIVHRDVKPENVLFTGGPAAEPPNKRGSGRALLADLGLAKHFDRTVEGASRSQSLTQHGAVHGTAGYMAPEQIEDARAAGPPADVFALGAVLYECLAGRPAFEGPTILEVLSKASSGMLDPLDRPDVPRWLEETLARALAPDPRRRFPDGGSFARALRAQGLEEGKRRGRAPIAVAIASGGLVLAAILVASGRTVSPPSPPPAPSPGPPAARPLPPGLRVAGRKVPAADRTEVPLYLYRLPDGSDMEMVEVPAGDFLMGADDPESLPNERPRHRHAAPGTFWIGRNDVTWAQHLAFCKASALPEPPQAGWWDKIPGTKNDHPVVLVSWEDARAYCDWARLQLPSEPEWEKAARGTDGRKWPWGNEWDPRRCNFADASCPLDTIRAGDKMAPEYFAEHGLVWDREHSDGFPYASPVGSFPGGVSPCGALDMAGNVHQWCEDWYDEVAYARYDARDLAPPRDGALRIYRCGSWYSPARFCRCAARGGGAPSYRAEYLGFRVCLRSG